MTKQNCSKTRMYGWLSADCREPLALTKQLQERRAHLGIHRDRYAELPWKLEDMPGTTWRNIWTGCEFTCEWIGLTSPEHRPQERPVMLAALDWTAAVFDHVGFWSEDRYVIDYWARSDHLSPVVQLDWQFVRLDYYRRSIDRAVGRRDIEVSS